MISLQTFFVAVKGFLLCHTCMQTLLLFALSCGFFVILHCMHGADVGLGLLIPFSTGLAKHFAARDMSCATSVRSEAVCTSTRVGFAKARQPT